MNLEKEHDLDPIWSEFNPVTKVLTDISMMHQGVFFIL